jgi:phosphoglycolate phosphatase-like HAD superfamily hydrolase
MQLIMFDIDGTLTQSNTIDNLAFIQTLSEVFNISLVNPDWCAFTHVTDSWILHQIYQSYFGYSPSEPEVTQFRYQFITRLKKAIIEVGGLKPIPGAAESIECLRKLPDFAVAYASGAFSDSALLKLKSANLPYQEIPCAFADDAYAREAICQIALQRSQTHYQREFSRVIYVGDGIWDAQASRNLGYHFIGIAYESEATVLISEGAKAVLSDFSDINQFLAFLE